MVGKVEDGDEGVVVQLGRGGKVERDGDGASVDWDESMRRGMLD